MEDKFGNVLTDHPDVLKQSQQYPVINNYASIRNLAEEFDGRDEWGTFLLSPEKQVMSSWALVAKDVLNDRFCILSGGQMMVNFDEFEIISCIDIPPNKKIDGVKSYPSEYKTIYQGYSIYDAWEYIYKYGVCQQSCFSKEILEKKDIKLPSKIQDYTDKIKLYGNNCSLLEDIGKTSCLVKKNKKPVARRSFFCDAIYNIKGKDIAETIEKIKYDICRFGPVAAGFVVYENFMDDKWKGRSIYEKAEGKVLGSHYVTIVGYGKDYWICRNSWGTDWGLLGYFKIKMGLSECLLEDNVTACMPYFSNIAKSLSIKGKIYSENDKKEKEEKEVNIFDMKSISTTLYKYRKHLRINFRLFYTEETILGIKDGQLYGSLDPIIKYPNLLPDLKKFWAIEILDYNYSTLAKDKELEGNGNGKKDWLYIISVIICCFFIFMLGFKMR